MFSLTIDRWVPSAHSTDIILTLSCRATKLKNGVSCASITSTHSHWASKWCLICEHNFHSLTLSISALYLTSLPSINVLLELSRPIPKTNSKSTKLISLSVERNYGNQNICSQSESSAQISSACQRTPAHLLILCVFQRKLSSRKTMIFEHLSGWNVQKIRYFTFTTRR